MDFSVFLDKSIHKNWVHKISSWKYLSEVLFSQFFPEHRMPVHRTEVLYPELHSKSVENQQLCQYVI